MANLKLVLLIQLCYLLQIVSSNYYDPFYQPPEQESQSQENNSEMDQEHHHHSRSNRNHRKGHEHNHNRDYPMRRYTEDEDECNSCACNKCDNPPECCKKVCESCPKPLMQMSQVQMMEMPQMPSMQMQMPLPMNMQPPMSMPHGAIHPPMPLPQMPMPQMPMQQMPMPMHQMPMHSMPMPMPSGPYPASFPGQYPGQNLLYYPFPSHFMNFFNNMTASDRSPKEQMTSTVNNKDTTTTTTTTAATTTTTTTTTTPPPITTTTNEQIMDNYRQYLDIYSKSQRDDNNILESVFKNADYSNIIVKTPEKTKTGNNKFMLTSLRRTKPTWMPKFGIVPIPDMMAEKLMSHLRGVKGMGRRA